MSEVIRAADLGSLAFSDEEHTFRLQFREWLVDNPPPQIETVDGTSAKTLMEWEASAANAGFVGLHWPVEYGGAGRGVGYQLVVAEEMARSRIPYQITMVGWYMVGPLLIALGSEEQKAQYLRGILHGRELWTQLFSEPGAGSDLAAISTTATADGDEFVVNGQKVWSSWAHLAHRGLLLARTDSTERKHQGLTLFAIEMDSPGLTVRPLRQMNAKAEFNEVFFDEVRVSSSNIIGQVNHGWSGALVVLGAERTGLTLGSYAGLALEVDELVSQNGAALDASTRHRLASAFTGVVVQRLTALRTASVSQDPHAALAAASVGKLLMTANAKSVASLRLDLTGPHGSATSAGSSSPALQAFLNSPSSSIGGGTSEVQRNGIGERILGLPKEPSSSQFK